MLKQVLVFCPTWNEEFNKLGDAVKTPVKNEIKRIWEEQGFGNDYYYFQWSDDPDLAESYPALSAFLSKHTYGTETILIHWWW